MSHIEWFLVANSARATVYARAEAGEKVKAVRSFEHPPSRLKTAELGDDKAGRELSGRGFGGAAFEPKLDPHRKEHLHFAHELCAFVEHEAQQAAFGSLTVFAPDPFLGEIKKALGPASTRVLAAAHDTDLSHVGAAELDRRIAKAKARERHE
ncbi:MAG TPA: host attachment protein [Ramlibacter sp.]|jgi:protein required for attachment to host cells